MEEGIDLFSIIEKQLKISKIDLVNYSPLTLAYIGDGIYEIVIRTIIVSRGNSQVNKLHKRASNLVKAPTQALMMKHLEEKLNSEELSVYKRGRNAKSFTMAKNASMSEYRTATGFEALMGYLYLSKQSVRMLELIEYAVEQIEKN